MKNSKKLVALLAVGTMMLASTVGVSAATASSKTLTVMSATQTIDAAGSDGVYSATLNVDVQTSVPVINISVPTQSGLIINPYGLGCQMGSTATESQIISPVQAIVNNSNVPVKVGVTVTTVPAADVKLSASTAQKLTTKSMCLVYNATVAKNTASPVTSFGNGATPLKVGTTTTGVLAVTANSFASIPLTTATTGVKPSVLTVEKDTGVYYFGITGDCSTASSLTWKEADKATISYAFTFTPSIIEKE